MRAQTATEFLVFISLALIGILIAIAAFQGLTQSAPPQQEYIDTLGSEQRLFAVTQYIYAPEGIHIGVANNYPKDVVIQSITIDGVSYATILPTTTVGSGEKKIITLYEFASIPSTYSDTMNITYCIDPCFVNLTTQTYTFSGEQSQGFITQPLESSEPLAYYLLYRTTFDAGAVDASRFGAQVLTNNTQYTEGQFGKAIILEGSSSQIFVEGVQNQLHFTDDRNYTFNVWLSFTDSYVSQLFQKTNGTTGFIWETEFDSSSESLYIEPIFYNGASFRSCPFTYIGTVLPYEQTMITWILREDSSTALYVNANLVNDYTPVECQGDVIEHGNNSLNPYIFRGSTATTVLIDDVMIFNRSLSAYEVRSLYERGN